MHDLNNFQGKLITTVKNIPNINDICQNLYQQKFIKNKYCYKRSFINKKGNIKKITQIITKNSDFNILLAQNIINQDYNDGFIIPTLKINEYLKHKPFPLSAQKQEFLTTLSKMNNQKINCVETIYIKQTGYLKNINNLPSNLPSQFFTNLHFNNYSSITVGESEIEDIKSKRAYGEAILQISHLKHHKIDLDLSIRIHQENQKIISQKLNQAVKSHQFCFNIPYNLNSTALSPHGYIVYLKGVITPTKINSILKQSNKQAFIGITISSGIAQGKIKTLKKSEKTENYIQESIGNYIYDPNFKDLKQGSWHSDQIGDIRSLKGETIMLLFPVLQNFEVISQ